MIVLSSDAQKGPSGIGGWVVFLERGRGTVVLIVVGWAHGCVFPNLYRQLPLYGSGILHSGLSPK